MKKLFSLLLVAAMCIMMFAGCGTQQPASTTAAPAETTAAPAETTAAPAAAGTIKIGMSGPLTGGASAYGIAVKTGMEIAVEEINALGGNIQNAYGISIDELKAAIPCGIGKINVDTDIRLAVTRNMKEFFCKYPEKRNSPSIGGVYKLLEEKKDQFDPRAFLPPIMDTVMYGNVPDEDVAALVSVIEKGVKEAIGTLIVEFGSYGKAPLVEQVSLEEMAERYKKM